MVDWTILVPLGVLLIATICDLRTREIPDSLSIVLLAWGLIAKLAGWITLPWAALLLGLALGLVVTIPLFWVGGLGGGDVKLITALGWVMGPVGLGITLLAMAIAGGALALLALMRGQKDYAYVPAILFGAVVCGLCEWICQVDLV
ncbi:prepilin peptidase [Bremerella cremea]|uniref:Prepilin peptidase n=1 Tax=Bremerella cremea TaxID=1031537 RepID=A0A368KY56_9BACT|nr:A24 family peptidase [Bremerella cremea]RCS54464.1 prepilin peptidase [Bremerella cremea]